MDLNGKVALITGGSRGVGAATALKLARQGCHVAINCNQTLERAKQIAGECQAIGVKVLVVPGDVSLDRDCRRIVSETIESFGQLDILINNASNDQRHSLENITEKYWDERMAINLKHYLFAIQSVKKSMVKNKGGSIINLGSVSWVRGAVMFPAYSTAKAGIHGLTRSLARDLGKYNIRINSIAPGSIATARQSKLWLNPKFKKEILKNQALKKQLLPEDVSKMVLFLASDISSGCTKQNFTVDAGLI